MYNCLYYSAAQLTVGRPCAVGGQFSIDYGAALRTVYDIYVYDIYIYMYK